MNRRDIMKLLGLGVVAPGAVAKALSQQDDKIHLADVLEMRRVCEGASVYPNFDPSIHVGIDPSDVRPHFKTTTWREIPGVGIDTGDPEQWPDGVPEFGDTVIFPSDEIDDRCKTT